ncbi:hypothetical protein C0J52_27736, partial [Blattella germanica]
GAGGEEDTGRNPPTDGQGTRGVGATVTPLGPNGKGQFIAELHKNILVTHMIISKQPLRYHYFYHWFNSHGESKSIGLHFVISKTL